MSRSLDADAVSARLDAVLDRHPAVGLAVGVGRDGALQFFSGRGLADIRSRSPVTEDTVFRVGSVTKTFTAVAVLQLVGGGPDRSRRAGRAAPALLPARPRRPRVAAGDRPAAADPHLRGRRGAAPVAPAAPGLRRDGAAGTRAPPLAEYYRYGLLVGAEPGTRRRYTGHGFATLGQLVEDVSGQPLDRYLRERVFRPLGMTHTGLTGLEARARLATGYTLRSRGPVAVPDYRQVTVAAGAAHSTPRDMGRYVAALLGGGANGHGAVLRAPSVATMFAPHYRPDPRIPGMGLAFFRTSAGGHRLVEHQGLVPGFDSQIFVAPDDGLGVMAFSNGTRVGGFWLPGETSRLLADLLGVPREGIRTDMPHHPEVWPDLCGWYHLPGPISDVRVRGMVGAGLEVFVRGGLLHLRFLNPIPALGRGFPLH